MKTHMDMKSTKAITEDRADLKLSRLLKEKGFNWPCREYYARDERLGHSYTGLMSQEEWMHNTENETPGFICTAPTLSYAEKWLRDEHGISIDVITDWEWTKDPMTTDYPEFPDFTGYYFEIHQLRPHMLMYDSQVVSEDRAETLAVALEKALGYIDGTELTASFFPSA